MNLSGLKEICKHINRSEPTVLFLVRSLDFPAKKIGGIWESDTKLIKKWRAAQLRADNGSAKSGRKSKTQKGGQNGNN